jgi:hypothetical protein
MRAKPFAIAVLVLPLAMQSLSARAAARSIFPCRQETIHMTWRPRPMALFGTLVS